MEINFFEDPQDKPRMREEVRLEAMRVEVSPEGRRLAVDLKLTPFIERPTLLLELANERGEPAGRLSIIETLDKEMTLVMHLRDKQPTDTYTLRVKMYYSSVDEEFEQQVVHVVRQSFAAEPGNVVFWYSDEAQTKYKDETAE